MLKNILLIGLGGAIGSVLRYLCNIAISKYFPSSFPWPTLAVNVFGCFLIGIFLALFGREHENQVDMRMLFVTGFCGGYTTFSAFALENLQLLQQGQLNLSVIYMIASIVLGLLAVWAGVAVVR